MGSDDWVCLLLLLLLQMFCIRRCASKNYPRPCPTPPSARKEHHCNPVNILNGIRTSRHALIPTLHMFLGIIGSHLIATYATQTKLTPPKKETR